MDEKDIERAMAFSEALLQAKIDSRVRYQGLSAKDCAECGELIPEARRVAVPGCVLCVDCKQIMEVK